MKEETALSLDYREFAPRTIILRAREAEEVLKVEYGEHDDEKNLLSHVIKYALFRVLAV